MAKALTRNAAYALAVTKWGSRAYVRDQGRQRGPSSPERRAAGRAAHDALKQSEPRMRKLMDWPADATVGEYRETIAKHNTAHRAWQAELNRTISEAHYYRYTVGEIRNSIICESHGHGDTWAEALTAAGIKLR